MRPPALDPDLLHAFVAVAEQLSFTRAAKILNRTQATVSLQVKRLEERVGVALFHRSTVQVELTAEGEGFLVDARRILALGEQALARLSDQQPAGRVRIGVMEDYGTKVLPGLLGTAKKHYPLIQVEMEIGLTAKMLKRLGSSFDLVIAMHPEGAAEGELLRREDAIWAAAPGHATEELDPLPVALSEPGCLFREWAIRALDNAARAWRLAYVSRSLAAVEAIVSQGLAVTIVKGSMLPPTLRAVRSPRCVPSLPGAEIRLHRAAALTHSAGLVVEHLARGLHSGGSGVAR
jgi:DNA-binding transcriptional LysR family regulator